MDEKTYRLGGAGALSVPVSDADKLLALGSGDCALLYLQVLRRGGTLHPALAARELGRSEAEIRNLAEQLRRAGIIDAESAPLPGPEELPEYTAADISRRSREDSAFRSLLGETQRVLGHALSSADLKTLFGIYDHLGLTPECIMLLINYEADSLRRRCGEGRLPTMRSIEREAFRWARLEILTAPQAEEYIAAEERRAEEAEKLRELMQLRDRAPSPTERRYMESWLQMGFRAEVLALAYDRTVTSTGKLAWAYMDKIVRSWAEKGLFTPEAVEKGDARKTGNYNARTVRSGTGAAPAKKGPDNTEALLKALTDNTKR